MSDWHESEAKAECLDLRLRVRELEAQYTRECEEHRREVELSDARDTLTRELAGELKEWRIRNPDGYEAAAQLVGALRSDVAELRADKARLDWLNDNANPAIYCPSDSGAFLLKWAHATNGRVPTLRDAIDLELDDEIATVTYTAAMQLMDDLK